MPRTHRRRVVAGVAVSLTAALTAGLALTASPSGTTGAGLSLSAAAAAPFGNRASVDIDDATGTPRFVARLDGHLTGPSSQEPRDVVLGYVRSHLADFGLTNGDLSSLTLRRTYVDVAGTTHLDWTQSFDGVEVFGHGLQAAVTDDGRLLTVGGSPVPAGLVGDVAGSRLDSPEKAIRAARRSQGERVEPGPRDVAEQVLFLADGRTHLAWQAITMSATSPALSVLDAATADVLFRRSLVHDARPERRAPGARGIAYRYYPGAPRGGRQLAVNFTARGWLPATATTLDGNNTHAFSDVNDDDVAQPTEEVGPVSGTDWSHVLAPFHLGWASFCDQPTPCSWNPNKPYSWRKNRKQATTQAFFHVNSFHDHLLADPIGFTEAAGNFQLANGSGEGLGGDAVLTHTSDGADAGQGLPDGNHVDTASMATPPDGQAPTLQLHLQHQPGTSYPAGDPYSPTNTADAADTVYHEYTHGLSNRLVVDAAGNSTLGPVQGGAMGEGWSDWYALDYLVGQGFQKDQPDVADVRLFQYDGAGADLARTEPLDCAKGSTSPLCDGGRSGHTGGYTYADYGDVLGVPEVHGDGEIWSQTLWDLRTAVGSPVARSLVTRAMELAPGDPSFLDMRNAILLADTAVFDGAHRATVWHVFARRGMGFFAGSLGGGDTAPAHDGNVPPTTTRKGLVTGTVTDADSGLPVAGARVTLAWQGGAGQVNPTTVTGSDGTYSLGPVPVGTYRKLAVDGAGYDPVLRQVTVAATGAAVDLQVRRDWAAASGGAVVASYTGPDYAPDCGPAGAIDGSLATGWGSSTGDDAATPTDVFVPKELVVDLGVPVDVSEFGVDPAATCGDGGSSSTGAFRIETSPDAVTWTEAATGTFTAADRGRLNAVVPTSGTLGVRYVKFVVLGNQTPAFASTCPDGAYTGCRFTDLSELAVRGLPS